MVNKAILIGNVGRSPEAGNGGVVRFSLATSKKGKKKDGSPFEKTTWHNIVAFSRLGEVIMQYVDKGAKIYIEGEIDNTVKENPDGTKVYYSSIIAREMQMLGGKSEKHDDSLKVNKNVSSIKQPVDEDIPF